MSNHPLQVNINSHNEHLFIEIESQEDITLAVEFIERLFKKRKNQPVTELKEVQVGQVEPRIPPKE